MGRVFNAIVGLGVATGFYFGYQVVMLAPTHEFFLYRGSFVVNSGDTFHPNLARNDSLEFEKRSQKYKVLIDSIFQEGPLNGVNVKSEILEFAKPVNASLHVKFQLHVASRTNIRVDTGDLFFTFSDMMISKNWTLAGGIIVNKDSLEMQALDGELATPFTVWENATLDDYIADARYESIDENNDEQAEAEQKSFEADVE